MMRAKDEGVTKSNRRAAAEMSVLHATRKITRKVEPEDFRVKIFGWMNVHPKDGYNAPHTQPGAHWPGVYYVSQPDTEDGHSGMIEFVAPRIDLPH